jgi:hypothetical protein
VEQAVLQGAALGAGLAVSGSAGAAVNAPPAPLPTTRPNDQRGGRGVHGRPRGAGDRETGPEGRTLQEAATFHGVNAPPAPLPTTRPNDPADLPLVTDPGERRGEMLYRPFGP